MEEIRVSLLSDGSSDRALLPIVRWMILTHLPRTAVQLSWADLFRLPRPPRTLEERITATIELYPCELLVIHRDAEGAPFEERVAEINNAVTGVREHDSLPPVLPVVPVRMQEAWLLFDEAALRQAAGNRHGRVKLALPRLQDVESVANPKILLHDLLRQAGELSGRRRRTQRVEEQALRITDLIKDFQPLMQVTSFASTHEMLGSLVRELGWDRW